MYRHRFRESFNQKLHYLPVEPLPCQFVLFKVRVWSVWFFLPSACGLVTSSAKSGQYDGVRATSSFRPNATSRVSCSRLCSPCGESRSPTDGPNGQHVPCSSLARSRQSLCGAVTAYLRLQRQQMQSIPKRRPSPCQRKPRPRSVSIDAPAQGVGQLVLTPIRARDNTPRTRPSVE